MANQFFNPEMDYLEESLISTAPGDEEGSTLMSIGLADLKREIRQWTRGQSEEDPLTTRRFYYPLNGVLEPVEVRQTRHYWNEAQTDLTNTYSVDTLVQGKLHFSFDIVVRGL